MVIDHIGIVVRSLESAIPVWQTAFGYAPVTAPVENVRQKVRVVFLAKSGSLTVKLVEPTDPSSTAHAAAARGGGLHHLCFRCADVKAGVTELRRLGMPVITEPQPGEAFDGANIAFLYAGQGLNVELIDTDVRAASLREGEGC